MMKQSMRIFIACGLLLQVSVFTMEPEPAESNPAYPISALPQDMNWSILEQSIAMNYHDIPPVLQRLVLTSKKNANFINSPETTKKLINLLNERTKNKARAAEILNTAGAKAWLDKHRATAEIVNTAGAKAWLDKYRVTDEHSKAFEQARADEQTFIELVSAVKPNLEKIKNYITKGINVNVVDETGWPALLYAAYNGETEIVKLLLSVPGINVNAPVKNGGTILDIVIIRESWVGGLLEIIELLKAAGAKPSPISGCTIS